MLSAFRFWTQLSVFALLSYGVLAHAGTSYPTPLPPPTANEEIASAAMTYRNCIDRSSPYRKGQCNSIRVQCDRYRAGDTSVHSTWCTYANRIANIDIENPPLPSPTSCTARTTCYQYYQGGHCGVFTKSGGFIRDTRSHFCEYGQDLCEYCAY